MPTRLPHQLRFVQQLKATRCFVVCPLTTEIHSRAESSSSSVGRLIVDVVTDVLAGDRKLGSNRTTLFTEGL